MEHREDFQAKPANTFGVYRKEQLGLYGNELNYMQSCWTAGYVIGQIPSNILLTRIRPSIWIPSLEVRVLPVVNLLRDWDD